MGSTPPRRLALRKSSAWLVVLASAIGMTALDTAPAAGANPLYETEGPFQGPYQNGAHGCNGVIGTTNVPGTPPSPDGKLRVEDYNIAGPVPKPTDGPGDTYLDRLNGFVDAIKGPIPDIVLLNEIKCRNWDDPHNQARYIAERVGMPFYAYEDVDWTGLAGTVGMAILSKYPIVDARVHWVYEHGAEPRTGTLDATVRIRGVDHRVLSGRFQPMFAEDDPAQPGMAGPSADENRDGPVIFGADFNAGPDQWWVGDFRLSSSLTMATVWLDGVHADAIYYRGPYTVSHIQAIPGFSGGDHDIAFAELTPTWSKVPVPPVVAPYRGADPSDAAATLRAAGLVVRILPKADPSCALIGRVMSMSPAAASLVTPGSTITMYVGSQPRTPCP